MSHKTELKEGALIISDAHYSHSRPELLALIKEIHSKKIITSQLILMGDIFDALFVQVPQTQKKNTEMIKLLNEISKETELIYLEGNHDFNLQSIFVNAKVIALSQQPFICTFKDKKVALAHGDFDIGFIYKVYSGLIRNSFFLSLLNIINTLTNNMIVKKLYRYLQKKDDCKEFIGFESYVQKRKLEKFNCEYFIEGHYHQNRHISYFGLIYINLAAFACNQRYFSVKLIKDNELMLEENLYVEI